MLNQIQSYAIYYPSKELYKFFDKEGNTLVLRPDFTPSIARCAAKYFMDENMMRTWIDPELLANYETVEDEEVNIDTVEDVENNKGVSDILDAGRVPNPGRQDSSTPKGRIHRFKEYVNHIDTVMKNLQVVKSNATPKALPKSLQRSPNCPSRMGDRGKDGNESFLLVDAMKQKRGAFRCCRWHNADELNYKQHLKMMKSTQFIVLPFSW